MKKILILFVTVLALVFVCVGCGIPEDIDDPTQAESGEITTPTENNSATTPEETVDITTPAENEETTPEETVDITTPAGNEATTPDNSDNTTPPHNPVGEIAAKNIAIEYFANIQASGICKDYVFQVIRSDSKQNTWIVIFYPEDPIPGSDYRIVVDKSTGAVIDAYPWG